jgi:Rrf2 family nitric oxide-sensitive transcriptional repressor
MKLRLQTDYALRVLIYLARTDDLIRVDAIAEAYGISREHLVKVVQALVRHGWARTRAGRGGGVRLAQPATEIDVSDVVGAFEGRTGVLECVAEPQVCVLEPGCRLRRKLIAAEAAFYAELKGTTVADLVARPRANTGLAHLPVS